jgi:prepilin-type N-terminal cleavage/methylation domain-containing protein
MKLSRVQRGFTLAELLVASVISAFLLAGMASLMRQFLTLETTLTVAQGERQQARQLAQYLENRLESVVKIKDKPAAKITRSKDGRLQILDLTYSDFNHQGPTMALLRISWTVETPVVCHEQSIPIAGSTVLLPGNVEDSPEVLEAAWTTIPARQIGAGIDSISINIRGGGDGPSGDQGRDASSDRLIFQVAVAVGAAREERLIMPAVNGKVLE